MHNYTSFNNQTSTLWQVIIQFMNLIIKLQLHRYEKTFEATLTTVECSGHDLAFHRMA